MMVVSVGLCVWLAVQYLNIGIFLDTIINDINVKLCMMMLVFIELSSIY